MSPHTPTAPASVPSGDRSSATLADARERAFRVLTDRFADDTLGDAEFEARLDAVYAAGSAAAVDAVLADLPGAVPTDRPLSTATAVSPAVPGQGAPAPAASAGWPAAPAATRPPAEELRVVLAERRFAGPWAPPAQLELVTVLGTTVLDLRQARLAATCEIDCTAVLAQVQVLLPPRVRLESRLSAFMATVSDDTASMAPVPDPHAPLVRLVGSAVLAEVVVRRASDWLPAEAPFAIAWKAAKEQAKLEARYTSKRR